MVFYFSYVLPGLMLQTLITLNYFKTHMKSHYDETRQTYQLKKQFTGTQEGRPARSAKIPLHFTVISK